MEEKNKGSSSLAEHSGPADRRTSAQHSAGWREMAVHLWMLLDDIDTASDAAKGDDTEYRFLVERMQSRRHEIMSGVEVDRWHFEQIAPPPAERGADERPSEASGVRLSATDEPSSPLSPEEINRLKLAVSTLDATQTEEIARIQVARECEQAEAAAEINRLREERDEWKSDADDATSRWVASQRELRAAEAKWAMLKDNASIWPLELRDAIDALEAQYDTTICSGQHLAVWVDRCEAAEAEVQRLTRINGGLVEALTTIDALEVMEINPSNYDHEIVCELNGNAVQAALIARAALAQAKAPAHD